MLTTIEREELTSSVELSQECPIVPVNLSLEQRSKVLRSCAVQTECTGSTIGSFSGKPRCCRGARSVIEMTEAVDSILASEQVIAIAAAEEARRMLLDSRRAEVATV